MLKVELLKQILSKLNGNDGLSYIELYKKLNLNCTPSKVQYWLKICEEDGFVVKDRSRYKLASNIFVKNGLIICVGESLMSIIGCPYYEKECKCQLLFNGIKEIGEAESCKLLKEEAEIFKHILNKTRPSITMGGEETR